MKLIKETIVWHPEIDGKTSDIPITVIYHPEALASNTTQIHFYPGLGEEVLLTKAGVKKLAECGLYAVGVVLPFHHLPATPANIQKTLIEVPAFMAEVFNKRAGNPVDKPVDLIGKSQGGGTVLLAACYAPEKYRVIAALLPAGLNKHAFGKTPKARLKQLKWRLGILNNLKKEQSLLELKNILAWYEVVKRLLGDTLVGRLNQKLDYTLSMDLTDLSDEFTSLPELSTTHVMAIFAGINDPVVRISEVRSSLKRIGLEHLLREVPSIHTNSICNAGQQQIGIVANWLKEVRPKNGE